MKHVGWLLFLAACGGAAAPPRAPMSNLAEVVRASGPAPTVTYGDGAFGATRLPAISANGVLVVTAQVIGGPGPAGLELVERNRADAVVHVEHAYVPDDEPSTEALVPANRYLARRNDELDLRPLEPIEVTGNGGGRMDQSAWQGAGRGVTIAFTQEDAHLTVTSAGVTTVDRTMDDWRVAGTPMCEDCEELCSNPPVLEGAWVDVGHQVAVLQVGYLGTDTCWEPDSAAHVVSW